MSCTNNNSKYNLNLYSIPTILSPIPNLTNENIFPLQHVEATHACTHVHTCIYTCQ